MSGKERHSKRVASVEDADDSDNPLEGTVVYAESRTSPSKQTSNTGRTRREKPHRDSSSPHHSGLTDSDSTVHPHEKPARYSRDSREYSPDQKRALAHGRQTVVAMRPAPHHANTTPVIQGYRQDDPAYYGITPASSRPRAATQRPASYYGSSQSRPPPSNHGYYARQAPPPPLAPHPPHAPAFGSSYPAGSWAGAGPVMYPLGPMPHISPRPPQHEPFYHPPPPRRDLGARFGGRPQSAMGHRHSRELSRDSIHYEDYALEEERPVHRRQPSMGRVDKHEEDRRMMPPPMRPPPRSQTVKPTMGYKTPAKKRVEDQEFDDSPGLMQDLSPQGYDPRYEFRGPRTPIPTNRARRPSVGAPTTSYRSATYHTEVAGRRNSYVGRQSVSSGSELEDKLRQAAQYQDEIGGPSVPLTAETLRRASSRGPTSSRSTRSSGSHDESDFRQSATTQTTRSSNLNDDDFTIRVKGNASLKVGGAEVRCEDGAEINISRNGQGSYRGGSDRSSFFDPDDRRLFEDRRIREDLRLEDRRPDDRRSRVERPVVRKRTTSQSGSFSRAPSRYHTSTPGPHYERPQANYEEYDEHDLRDLRDEYGYPLVIPPPNDGYF